MPQQKQSFGQKAMQGVRNFGAGLAGVGPEYIMMQKQEQNQLSRDREMAMVRDAMQVKKLLDSREYDQAINLIDNRVKAISKLGGDPSDTLGLRQMIVSGNVQQASQGLDMFLSEAQSAFPEVFAPKELDPSKLIDGRYRGSVDPMTGQVSMDDVYAQGGVQAPAPGQTEAFRTLNDRAVAAGLQPGTPQYQEFMRGNGQLPEVETPLDRIQLERERIQLENARLSGQRTQQEMATADAAEQRRIAEEQQAIEREAVSNNALLEQASMVADYINEAFTLADTAQSGWTSSVMAGVSPSGQNARYRRILQTIKSNIGFDKLMEMKRNSPTGGALGAVSERELSDLQATLGSLDAKASDDEIKSVLTKVHSVYDRINRGAGGEGLPPLGQNQGRVGRFTVEPL